MGNNSLFIAIEGLDGSGKTTIARQLAYFIKWATGQNIKLTFEPHDASSGGLYIRQVLEKKITDFSHESLMLAFAANRLDHCNREINPWLAQGEESILICDRYYLSSLVYQSNDQFPFEAVMEVNQHALRPDLTIFMNVSNEVCYQRMAVRNKPKELFEHSLSETRDKYLRAIEFLRERGEEVVVMDAGGTKQEVLSSMVGIVSKYVSESMREKMQKVDAYNMSEAEPFSIDDSQLEEIDSVEPGQLHTLTLNQKALLFLKRLKKLGYQIGKPIADTLLKAYQLNHDLPGGIQQRGVALLLNESQQYDGILSAINELNTQADFIFVFLPGPAEVTTKYYEREMVRRKEQGRHLSPTIQIVTEEDLVF